VNWYQLIDAAASSPPAIIAPSDPPTPRYWCAPLPQKQQPPFSFKMPPHNRYASAKLFCEGIGSAFARVHGIVFIAARLGWCPRRGQEARSILYNTQPSTLSYTTHNPPQYPTQHTTLHSILHNTQPSAVSYTTHNPPLAHHICRQQADFDSAEWAKDAYLRLSLKLKPSHLTA
jgi:hypothetical protein